MPSSWSRGGKLAFVELNATSREDILVLPTGEGTTPRRPWPNARFDEAHPDWSPDGRLIAYDSSESGRSEVYVQAYPVLCENSI